MFRCYLYIQFASLLVWIIPVNSNKGITLDLLLWKETKSIVSLSIAPRLKKMLLHKAGCREHGLIKGKAEFSSCRSRTDRQKHKRSLRHKPFFSAGGSHSLEAPDIVEKGKECMEGRGEPAQKFREKKTFQTPDFSCRNGSLWAGTLALLREWDGEPG